MKERARAVSRDMRLKGPPASTARRAEGEAGNRMSTGSSPTLCVRRPRDHLGSIANQRQGQRRFKEMLRRALRHSKALTSSSSSSSSFKGAGSAWARQSRGLAQAAPEPQPGAADPLAPFVRIVEVAPRDGLQNEQAVVGSDTKIELIRRLQDAGAVTIEAGSFVSPKWVPQVSEHSKAHWSIRR